MKRDIGIDLIRGVAMITIAINHAYFFAVSGGYQGPRIPTPTVFGLSSAAELFVGLSGYMVGMVYARREQYGPKLAQRAGKLYILNAVMLAALSLFVLVVPANLVSATRLEPYMNDPGSAVINFLTLQHAPNLLDVLQLYIIFMITAIPATWLLRKSLLIFITSTALIYCIAQIALFSGHDIGANPFWLPAWQFLFFGSMAAGFKTLHVPIFAWIDKNTRLIVVPFALLALTYAYIKLGPVLGYQHYAPKKGELSIVRILHAVTLVAFYAFMIALTRRWHQTKPLQSVALIGRQTLNGFLASIVFTYYGVLFIAQPIGGIPGYLLMTTMVLASVYVCAAWSERRKNQEKALNPGYRKG
ncbi:hypothetical protein H4S14_000255 [Agrobacterium vitis]|nr:hypothetical protein [Agrobacterium vitis]MBE1436528.1 hypothetical protein [Agrobacterium vitis]